MSSEESTKKKSTKALVIYSGGLDSTVLLHYACEVQHNRVEAISFDYGQRHGRELTYAKAMTRSMGLNHWLVDVPLWVTLNSPDAQTRRVKLFKGSSQTDPTVEVPLGHYEEESMKATVVPNRNMTMLALAGAFALSNNIPNLYYGPHAGDHAIYPDCRKVFVMAMKTAFTSVGWVPLVLNAPFLHMSKAEIVKLGAKLGVPFYQTWSCYKGEATHCGHCGTCVERREAFQIAGVEDPTTYSG